MSVLIVNNLTKTFSSGLWLFTTQKKYTAVDSISFELKESEILGFLGHNGAGKTTAIQMLLGTLIPTAGTIHYFGKDFSKHRIGILKKVTYASGYDKLPARLTIWENLDVFGRIYGIAHAQRIEQIESLLKFFDLWDMRTKETGLLSAGQATRVALAKAFLPNPRLVLLDEPTAALDPDSANEVRKFILKQQKEHGVSVLFTSHNMPEVTEVCDRVLVLKEGSIIADNTPEKLAAAVSHVHLNLVVTHGLEHLIAYLHEKNMIYKLHEHSIEIEVDEHAIAALLIALAGRNIIYSAISIDKPTLEDYFLTIAKN